jgi:DNA primase
MHPNAAILSSLVEQDFGVKAKEGSRWGKSEEHSSLVIDFERGIFFWNARDIVGDPLVYLTRVRGMTFVEARNYLHEYKDYSSTFVYTINSAEKDIVVYPKLVDIFNQDGKDKAKREYWYNRGIEDSTIDRFQLGWYNNFVTVPIFMEGTFRNFQLRKDNPKTIRQYYKGVGALLYNSSILSVVDRVYITEGLTDCLIMNQNGFPAVSHNDGAAGWKEEWFQYFIRQKEIYVLFDNDSAGRKGAFKVAKNLGIYRTKIFTFEGFDEKDDCVEFFRQGGNKEELEYLIHNNAKYTFELEK